MAALTSRAVIMTATLILSKLLKKQQQDSFSLGTWPGGRRGVGIKLLLEEVMFKVGPDKHISALGRA